MDMAPSDDVDRLIEATNDRDLDALADCFAEDVRSIQPAHPSRSFVGREQVRQNWARILGGIPDLETRVVDRAVAGDRVFAELAFDGHRPDGAPFRLRGVTVNRVRDGRIDELHFYMEPIDAEDVGIDEAVGAAVGAAAPTGNR